jgi:glycosyltransferase XagB
MRSEDKPSLELAPPWTILIAVYKEKDSIDQLLKALDLLDWPKDKLDILFACEADDFETLEALDQAKCAIAYRVIRVPRGGPRTKPNALQTALPFARGRFLSVYDAEDRPDPMQLRDAFAAFLAGPSNLAVVQAPLVTDNDQESWIAQQFALDYAIWFRVVLPALVRLSGLLPLGGTSNHFRISALHSVGGWDPWNVTEDADLGVRLARQGYRAGLIATPTYEEAPPRLQGWVKQRGRWIQGHLQTLGVHTREPIRLYRSLGPSGVCAFLLGLGVGPLSAIAIVPFWVMGLCSLFSGASPIVATGMVFGLLAHVAAAALAISRDGRARLWWAVLGLPVYHLLQLPAVGRALFRVTFTPSIWDKTDHGAAARTSWTGLQRSSSLD